MLEDRKRSAVFTKHLEASCMSSERRSKVRLEGLFPAGVRGLDWNGETFKTQAFIENISAGGFYLRLGHRVETGVKLFVITRLNTSLTNPKVGPLIALTGRVLRVEPHAGDEWGVAVEITHHRFL